MSSPHTAPYYFVPAPSRWPLAAGLSMLVTMAGASGWVNGTAWGPGVCVAGILAMFAFQRGSLFFGIFFAYFAVINYQVLQSLHHAAKYGNLDAYARAMAGGH